MTAIDLLLLDDMVEDWGLDDTAGQAALFAELTVASPVPAPRTCRSPVRFR